MICLQNYTHKKTSYNLMTSECEMQHTHTHTHTYWYLVYIVDLEKYTQITGERGLVCLTLYGESWTLRTSLGGPQFLCEI